MTLTIPRGMFVLWAPEPRLCLASFTSANLLASTLGLATRYPLRWIVGSVIGFYIVSGVGDPANAVWLGNALERLLDSLFEGPYGLDALLTARTTFLNIEATSRLATERWCGGRCRVSDSGRRPPCSGRAPAS